MTDHQRGVVDLAATSELAVTATVVRTGLRPWAEKWGEIRHGRDAVDAIYAGTFEPRSDVAWQVALTDALVSVTHLADWLEGDKATGVPNGDAKAFAHTDAAVRVAVAFANTAKHHTRNQGGDTARILSITSGCPNEIMIELVEAHGATRTYDARALVHDCVAAWTGYLVARGLGVPS